MAAIGSGINPALGRVDYSPFLQGAQMAAQGRMQGSAALSEGVSQGFQDYLKKREQNAVLEGRNASLIRAFAQDPTLKNFAPDQKALDGLMAKMAKGGGLTLNDNMKLNAELQTTVDLAEKAREAQMKQLYAKQAEASVKKMAYDLDQAKQTDEAWGRYSELSRGFTKDTTYDEKVKAVAEAGLPPEAASRALGNVINAEQLGLARERAALDKRLADQKLKEDAANSDFLKRVRDGTEKGFGISVDANGREILTDKVRGISTQIDTGKPPPATQGEKIAAYAKAFQQAEKDGNALEQDIQVENLRSALGDAGKLEAREELASRLRDFGKGALLVKGKPKPVSVEPAPSAQDMQATQPANPAQASTQAPAQASAQTSTQTPAQQTVQTPAQPANLSLAAAATGFTGGIRPFSDSGQAPAQPPAQAPSQTSNLSLAGTPTGFMGQTRPFSGPESAPSPAVSANAPSPMKDAASERSTAQVRADRNEAVADALRAFGLEAKRVLTPESWRTDENQKTYLTDKSKLDTLMSRYDSLSNKKSPTAVRLSNQIDELSKEMAQKRKESEADARKRQILEAVLNQELPQTKKREDRSPGWILRRMTDEQRTKLRKAFRGPGATLDEMLARFEEMEKRR